MPVAADDVVWLDVLPSMGRFRQELEQGAGSSADTAGRNAGGRFSGAFSKALKIGAVVGGALAVAGGAAFLKEATREASDLGESLNAVQVTFGKSAEGINALGKAAATSVGLSQSQFNGLAVQFSAFATSIAGKGGDVTGVMKDLTTRGADFASVMNLDVNEAMGTFQSGLAGETEPLRKYGIDLSAAAVESYAYANGIAKAGEELTEQQKVQARYGSLMEQTAKVQGDFANTSDSLANSQRVLGARWDDIQAKVGGKVIPILEKFSGWVAGSGLSALQDLGNWLQSTFGPIFTEIVGGITAFGAAWSFNDGEITSSGFPGFMERVGFIAHQVFDYFRDTLIPTMRDIAGAVLPALGTAFQTVGGIVSSTVSFFRDHETAAKALGGVVAFVAGLVAAAWVAQATVSTINAAKSVLAWFATATASTTSATIQSKSTAQIVVGWVAASAAAAWNGVKIVAAWAVSVAQTGILMAMYASQSVAAAARSTAAWVASQVRTVASLAMTAAGFVVQGAVMLASMAVTAAGVVASWVVMGVQSMIQAARMAAAWLIAMGPVGWVIAAVIGLVALIVANWDTVVRWTKIAWDAVVGAVVAAWDWIKGAVSAALDFVVWLFMNFTGPGLIIQHWDTIVAATQAAWDWIVGLLTGVFDWIKGLFVALGDALIATALFIWDGIKWYFTTLWNGVVLIFTTVRDTVVGLWNGFRDLLVAGAQTIWTWITDKFTGMKDAVVGIFQAIKDTVASVWNGLLDAVKTPIRVAFEFVNANMIGPVNSILSKFPGNLQIPGLPKLAGGGLLRGPGTGTSDSILGVDPRSGVPTAAVSNGEFVVREKQTKKHLPLLRAINQGLGGFADGGLVGRMFGVKGYGLGDLVDGAGNLVGGAWNAAKGAVGSVANFATDMVAKGARKAAELVLGPIKEAVLGVIPNKVPLTMLAGGIERLYNAVLGKADEKDTELRAVKDLTASPGSSTGLTPNMAAARQYAMDKYGIRNIGGFSRRNIAGTSTLSDHALGKAIDIMTTNLPLGWQIANDFAFGEAHRRFGIENTIWQQSISSSGRPFSHMADRGSPTQNHRDHIHADQFDQGGLWESGKLGVNLTGGIERVLTPQQDDYFRRFVDTADRLDFGRSAIEQLHIHEVHADMEEAIGAVNHWTRVYSNGGRYAGSGRRS